MTAQSETAQLLLNAQRLRAGVILAIVGASLGAFGSVLAGFEVAHATRRWLAESGYPPSEVARAKMHQAITASRAAREAAFDAWQHDGPVTSEARRSADGLHVS